MRVGLFGVVSAPLNDAATVPLGEEVSIRYCAMSAGVRCEGQREASTLPPAVQRPRSTHRRIRVQESAKLTFGELPHGRVRFRDFGPSLRVTGINHARVIRNEQRTFAYESSPCPLSSQILSSNRLLTRSFE